MIKREFIKLFSSLKQEFILIGVSFLLLLIFIPVFTYLYFANDLKSTNSIMNRNNTGVILYDRNGNEFFKFYEAKYKKYVPLSHIPKHVRQSVIVAEDKEFYSHPGFSIRSIFAAAIANLKSRELSYGGSTITQQLVKNSLLNSRKNFLRKYQEGVLAYELERRFSKDQILEMYLNSVYFGEGAFGIEAASQTYFGKSADKLTIPEASLLAGILTSPSSLSPVSGDLKLAKERQEYVLSQMGEEKYISQDTLRKSTAEKLVFTNANTGFPYDAPHFALTVKQQLIEKYGEEKIARSGFKIYTTLDLTWQEYAESVVKEQVQSLKNSNVTNGAAVVIEPQTGAVRVMVGSYNWDDQENGKVNMAINPRQPGSAFKPLIYAEALDRQIITPATVLQDRKRTFPGNYKPENYDDKFRGPVLVRRALANSLNVPSVDIMERLGVDEGLATAKRFGISTLKDSSNYGLSLVLGTGEVPLIELTNTYAMFANNGYLSKYTLIESIEDKNGAIIFQHKPEEKKVLGEESTFLISSMLSDNNARREVFGSVLTISRPAAVKTGTTEDYRDSLTVGYTPQLAVGVWVGNNNNQEMSKIAGSIGAAPIWRMLMTKFHEQKPVMTFKKPDSLIAVTICSNGIGASASAMTEYFVQGTEPVRRCGSSPRPRARSNQERIFITPQPQESTPVPTAQPTPVEGVGGPPAPIVEAVVQEVKAQSEQKNNNEEKKEERKERRKQKND